MILPSPKIIQEPLLFSALVVDTLDAERMLIFDRFSGFKIAHFLVHDGVNVRILPLKYALEPSLSVVIFDGDNQYSAAIADNVQTMIIDIFTFKPSNPQSYEPPVS